MVQIAGKPFTQLTNLNVLGELRINGNQSGPSGKTTNSSYDTSSAAVTTTETLLTKLIENPTTQPILNGFTAQDDGFKFAPTGEAKKGLFHVRVRMLITAASASQSVIFDVAKETVGGTVIGANTVAYTFTVGTSNFLIDVEGQIELSEGDVIGVSVRSASSTTTIKMVSGDFQVGELSPIGA